jgi:hypothetical protein
MRSQFSGFASCVDGHQATMNQFVMIIKYTLIKSHYCRSQQDLRLEWKRWLFSVTLRQGARSQALQLRL